MPNYKKGDLVKITANTSNHRFVIGDTVKILDSTDNGYMVEYLDGSDRWYVREKDMEPVESPKEHTYKVGDRAKVVANRTKHGFKIGEEVIISELDESDGSVFSASKTDNTDQWCIDSREIEPVESEPKICKVGDMVKVIANTSGHLFDIGEVVRIIRIDGLITAETLEGVSKDRWTVRNSEIEPAESAMDPEPKTYTVDREFLMEGLKEADPAMRTKIVKKFPTLLDEGPKKVMEFGPTHTVTTRHSEENPLLIGKMMAPPELYMRCLIVNKYDGWKMRVTENPELPGWQVLVFEKDRS